jgi:hypothetical protein
MSAPANRVGNQRGVPLNAALPAPNAALPNEEEEDEVDDVSNTYAETQEEHLCGKHAYNMVLQEEKLVWRPDVPDMPYLSSAGEPHLTLPWYPESKLNMAAMCAKWPELRRYQQARSTLMNQNPGMNEETLSTVINATLEDEDNFPIEPEDYCEDTGDFPAELLEDLSWRELDLRINDVQLINFPKELNTPGCLGAVINYFDPSIQNHYCAVIKYPNSPYEDRPYAIGESLNDPPITYYSFDGLMCALQRLGYGEGPMHITCIYADKTDSLTYEAVERMMALGEEWRPQYADDKKALALAQRETKETVNAAKRGIIAGQQSVAAAKNAVLAAAAENAAAENASAVVNNVARKGGRKTRKYRKHVSRTRSKRRV